MPVDVMMFGGHRDGQILSVPGSGGVPDSKTLKLTINPQRNMHMKSEEDLYGEQVEKKIVTLEIVPRHRRTGPRWKIDLPKELW